MIPLSSPMNDSITNSPQKITSSLPSSDSKLSNQNSTTDDDDQIQSPPSPQKEPTFSFEEAKEALSRVLDFTDRRMQIISKITEISEQTDDKTKRIIELKRLIFDKPLVQEVIEYQRLFDSIDCKPALKEFLSDITNTLCCLKAFQNFKNDIETSNRILQNLQAYYTEDVSQNTSLEIESIWEEIYKLPIHDPVLINEISKIEWAFRARDALSHCRASPQFPSAQYFQALKKAALVSQDNDLIESSFYKKIEEELQKYQSLIDRVNFIFEQERKETPVSQEQKTDIQKVKELLQELEAFGFGMKEGVDYVKGILKRSESIENNYTEFLKKGALTTPNDLKKLLLSIENFPFSFHTIQKHLRILWNERREQEKAVIQETIRKIIQENRELEIKFFHYAQETSENSGTLVSEEDIWRVTGEEMQKISEYSAKLIQKLPTFKFKDFCKITKQYTTESYRHIKDELWLAKIRLLRISNESIIKPFKPIPHEDLGSFKYEIFWSVFNLPESKAAPFHEHKNYLYHLDQEIIMALRRVKPKDVEQGIPGNLCYRNINVAQYLRYMRRKVISLNKKRSEAADLTEEIDLWEKIEKKMRK